MKYRISRLLALSGASLLLSTPVLAAPWVRLNGSPSGDLIWANVGSITEREGLRAAWVRTDFVHADRSGATSLMAQLQYDCGRRETALLNAIYYDARGRVVSSTQMRELDWRTVVPDSVGEGDFNFVCLYPIGADRR